METGMYLKLTSLILVLGGAALLTVSLLPTRYICRDDEQKGIGWRVLFILIQLFIIGYLSYAYMLLGRDVNFTELTVSTILFGGGWFVVVVTRMSLRSIRHVRHIAARERHHALHDILTDLPNRTLLHERVNHAITIAKRYQHTVSILLMDLDRFKEVNDTLGHHCGDRLLQQVAPRLRRAVRETDTVARLGGDEFAVVLPDTDLENASHIARKILKAVEEPFMVEGHSLDIGVSIGIAVFPESGTDYEALLQSADIAMYMAKRQGSGFAGYDAAEDEHTLNRLTMLGDLKEAINNNDLVLHYQPLIDIASREVRSAEALVRWMHPTLGMVPPMEFIPMAEQSGFIRNITQWVLRSTLSQIQQWQQQGIDLNVSVNLSVKDIQDIEFPGRLLDLLGEYDVSPSSLILEITESGMMTDSHQAAKVINRLHAIGVILCIDDFGTGYSSLAYLKQLPTSVIKIDKSFVIDMTDDENDAVIVRSTIDLAHNMGRKVVAEGVENRDTLDLLEILRCDHAQGFHICRPLPAEQLQLWLNNTDWSVKVG